MNTSPKDKLACPFCGHGVSKVTNSRPSEDPRRWGQQIERRRECRGCGKRFTTDERIRGRFPRLAT